MPVTTPQIGTAARYTPPKQVVLPKALDTIFALRDATQLRVLYFYRPNHPVNIIPRVISIDWEESREQLSRTFTISLDNYQGKLNFIKEGGVVRLVVGPTPHADWIEWFRGIVVSRSQTHSTFESGIQIVVEDMMRNLVKSEGNFTFPAGITATQHIRRMLNRLGIPIGHLTDTRRRLNGFRFNGSFADAINILLERTKKAGGLRFVPEFADGKFWLVRYTEPVWTYRVGEVITSVTRARSIENVITKMVLHTKEHYTTTTPGKARKTATTSKTAPKPPKPVVKKKTRVIGQTLWASDEALKAFGTIQMVVTDDQIPSADLKQAAKDRLAKYTKPEDTLAVEIAGAALTVRRLQMVRFDDDEITQASGPYTVDALSGHLGSEGATVSLTLTKRPEFPEAPLDAAEEFGKGSGDADSVAAILNAAKKFGIKDPAVMVAASIVESSLNPEAEGDKNAAGRPTSFGLFQLHEGGLLGKLTREEAFDPQVNAETAARAFAGAGGKTTVGNPALVIYVTKVARPADPTGYIKKAWAVYTQAQKLVTAAGKAAGPAS